MAEPPRVVLSGWYGQENAGDEAMLQVLLEGLERRLDEVAFTVLSERPERVEAVHGPGRRLEALEHPSPYGWRHALARAGWRATLRIRRSLRSAQLFVLGGGSLLRDTSLRNYHRLLDELWFAEGAGVPAAIVGVSAGPLRTIWGRALTRRLLSRVALVAVRDRESRDELLAIGLAPGAIDLAGDLTLALAPPEQRPTQGARPIVLAPCAAMLRGLRDGPPGNPALLEILAEVADRLHERTGAPILLQPFRSGVPGDDDAELCRAILERMAAARQARVVEPGVEPRAVKARLAGARLVIAARFHALHFALHSGVPVLGIHYGPKGRRLLEDCGLPEYSLAPREASVEALLALHERLEAAGEERLAGARECLRAQAARVELALDSLAELARGGRRGR